MPQYDDIIDGEDLVDVRTKHNTVGELTYQSSATGLIMGGVPSVASGTTFNITAGCGRIIDDYTDPENPDITEVTWGAQNGISPTYLNTAGVSRVKFDSAGTLIQQSTPFTDDDYRDFICIANLVHTDFATLTDTAPAVFNPVGHATFAQFLAVFGGINLNGNIYSRATVGNLALMRSAGSLWKLGSNYQTDAKNPNISTSSAEDAVPVLLTVYNDGTPESVKFDIETVIDPTTYDDQTGTLNTYGGASTQATARYIYFFPTSGATAVVVGQEIYSSLDECMALAPADNPYVPLDFNTEGTLRGILGVTKGCTDLNTAADASFSTITSVRVG